MKAKLFHAGKGLWEVRYKKKDSGVMKTFGRGYFMSKSEATKKLKRLWMK